MSHILTGPAITAATLNLVRNFDPQRIPRGDMAEILTAFMQPLTTDLLCRDHLLTLIEAGEDWYGADQARRDHFEIVDEKAGAWDRAVQKKLRRVQVVAESIADGGTP